MRRLILSVLILSLSSVSSYAGLWESKCSSCHNGKVAPAKETLLKKYKNPDQFILAVRKAVMGGKMPRGLGYRFVARELYGKFPSLPCRRRCKNCLNFNGGRK